MKRVNMSVFVKEKEDFTKRYFYCANLDCYNIKRKDYIFCDEHTIYNTYLLKKKPEEIDIKTIEKILVEEVSDNIRITL